MSKLVEIRLLFWAIITWTLLWACILSPKTRKAVKYIFTLFITPWFLCISSFTLTIGLAIHYDHNRNTWFYHWGCGCLIVFGSLMGIITPFIASNTKNISRELNEAEKTELLAQKFQLENPTMNKYEAEERRLLRIVEDEYTRDQLPPTYGSAFEYFPTKYPPSGE